MRIDRAMAVAAGLAAVTAVAISPAVASATTAETITPRSECRYPTPNGDWFTLTYDASGIGSSGEFIAAGTNTQKQKNTLSAASVTQGSGQQGWIERFYSGSRPAAFAVWVPT